MAASYLAKDENVEVTESNAKKLNDENEKQAKEETSKEIDELLEKVTEQENEQSDKLNAIVSYDPSLPFSQAEKVRFEIEMAEGEMVAKLKTLAKDEDIDATELVSEAKKFINENATVEYKANKLDSVFSKDLQFKKE